MADKFPFGKFLDLDDKKTDDSSKSLAPFFPKAASLESTIGSQPKTSNILSTNFINPEKMVVERSSAPSDLVDIDNEIKATLLKKIPPAKFKAFFSGGFTLTSLSETEANFNVSTQFIKNMIDSQYLTLIEEVLYSLFAQNYKVHTTVSIQNKNEQDDDQFSFSSDLFAGMDEDQETKVKSVKDFKFSVDLTPTVEDLKDKVDSKYISHLNPDQTEILIDPTKTFNNFIIGPSNNMAYATAKAVVQKPGNEGKYPSLYYYSDSGLGKTHLLHAVANGIREQHPHLKVCLITAKNFVKELISAMQNNNFPVFEKKYSEKVDVLMIDDIHELENKKGSQDQFFHIFNELYSKGKQLIFTSDKTPAEIKGIEERIKTRLQWGLVIDIQRPDLETRIAILKRKAKELDFFLPEDVINLIACSIKTSIRELEGSLIKLAAHREIMDTEIDADISKDLLNLKDIPDGEKSSLENIAKAASHYFKVPLVDLKSKSRNQDIAYARHIAMYLSQKLTGATLQDIGIFYGGRDHTSVLHATRKIKDMLIANNASVSKDLIVIESNF